MLQLLPVNEGKWVRHIVPISGKDSLATALLVREKFPDKNIEYFYNQIGTETPEIYDWLDRVEKYLDKPIFRIGADLIQIIKQQKILPSHQRRFCTRMAKIEPMEAFIGNTHAFVYFGIRADEQRIGYRPIGKTLIMPVYPLQAQGMTINQVWEKVASVDLLPPSFFWQEIYDRVVALLPDKTWLETLNAWEKVSLFAGRSRPNCYNCFYQRNYEFIWLHEHHPYLFEKMCELEESTGSLDFTIRQNIKMRELPLRAEKIKEARVKKILQIIAEKQDHELVNPAYGLYQSIFNFAHDEDELSLTSCGLFCGK